MTLSSAIRTATSSLATNSQQMSSISRNIAGVGDPNYVRRESQVYSGLHGTTHIETQRRIDRFVQEASLAANATAGQADILARGFDRLAALQGVDNFASSPAGMLADLQQAVELAASSPADNAVLTSLVEEARAVAGALNAGYDEILSMRETADKEIKASVDKINSLLSRLEGVNNDIVNGSRVGREMLDSQDIRDQILEELSAEIGINVVPGEHNDIILTTSNGVLLFEGRPREVSFEATPSYGPGSTGGALRIDGVTVSGSGSLLPLKSGKIAANLELRDTVYVQQENQLDEIARGLITLFAEQDQTGGGKPPLAGLFTWSGGPAIPPAALIEPGIASTIAVNPLVDPQAGGNPALIRDGVINGDADYLYNTAGGPGFSDRLYALSDAFSVGMVFDPTSGLPSNLSVSDYATSALDQLNGARQSSRGQSTYQNELAFRLKQSLQSESGPNLDQEMSHLLEVERAYQATARVLSTVDQMLDVLMEATR